MSDDDTATQADTRDTAPTEGSQAVNQAGDHNRSTMTVNNKSRVTNNYGRSTPPLTLVVVLLVAVVAVTEHGAVIVPHTPAPTTPAQMIPYQRPPAALPFTPPPTVLPTPATPGQKDSEHYNIISTGPCRQGKPSHSRSCTRQGAQARRSASRGPASPAGHGDTGDSRSRPRPADREAAS
jgi:hypothetical protein